MHAARMSLCAVQKQCEPITHLESDGKFARALRTLRSPRCAAGARPACGSARPSGRLVVFANMFSFNTIVAHSKKFHNHDHHSNFFMASEEYLTRLHDAGSAPALASVPPGVACIVTCRPTCAINTPTRYRLLIMCFVASVLNYSDRQNIAYAIVNMAPDLGWTEAQKGWVLSSFMIGALSLRADQTRGRTDSLLSIILPSTHTGYLFSNIPAGWLANRFGGRFAMLLGAFLWSSFTVLTPVAARFSFGLLIACRIGLGFSEGVCWPAAHALLNKWFPAGERSRAVAWFTSGAHIGNILTIIVAPPLVVGAGWPWAFYLFGGLGFVFLADWVWVVHEEPAEHPTLSDTELHYIRSGASSDGDNDKRAASFAMVDSVSPLERVAASPRAIPWRLFFTSRQVCGVLYPNSMPCSVVVCTQFTLTVFGPLFCAAVGHVLELLRVGLWNVCIVGVDADLL